ncbi:hypothetical protein PTSG_05650 [Salpingoeca rosetta]|uniref:RNA methyltransferase n=1 Tax=Salpingoeca rosetta (strain ATCC 50818 / BSB-021) TaxID=946362 RepID=F2UBU0_SALR5|nr:uncharacterized protein PTSG_05650 [Salpingoeca rosetta]EGD73956.1 hypothetical protein PTSG_05650 [Salpingoeca rosetta]|eukprot:XP_004993519.1 hypothetical protein PTSG_05650 [Salpingoeca rosetta]
MADVDDSGPDPKRAKLEQQPAPQATNTQATSEPVDSTAQPDDQKQQRRRGTRGGRRHRRRHKKKKKKKHDPHQLLPNRPAAVRVPYQDAEGYQRHRVVYLYGGFPRDTTARTVHKNRPVFPGFAPGQLHVLPGYSTYCTEVITDRRFVVRANQYKAMDEPLPPPSRVPESAMANNTPYSGNETITGTAAVTASHVSDFGSTAVATGTHERESGSAAATIEHTGMGFATGGSMGRFDTSADEQQSSSRVAGGADDDSQRRRAANHHHHDPHTSTTTTTMRLLSSSLSSSSPALGAAVVGLSDTLVESETATPNVSAAATAGNTRAHTSARSSTTPTTAATGGGPLTPPMMMMATAATTARATMAPAHHGAATTTGAMAAQAACQRARRASEDEREISARMSSYFGQEMVVVSSASSSAVASAAAATTALVEGTSPAGGVSPKSHASVPGILAGNTATYADDQPQQQLQQQDQSWYGGMSAYGSDVFDGDFAAASGRVVDERSLDVEQWHMHAYGDMHDGGGGDVGDRVPTGRNSATTQQDAGEGEDTLHLYQDQHQYRQGMEHAGNGDDDDEQHDEQESPQQQQQQQQQQRRRRQRQQGQQRGRRGRRRKQQEDPYVRVSTFQDTRLAAFPPEWFRGKTVLDIGCNTGYTTLEIAQRFEPRAVRGIDRDPLLIARCRRKLQERASECGGQFPRGLVHAHGPLTACPTDAAHTCVRPTTETEAVKSKLLQFFRDLGDVPAGEAVDAPPPPAFPENVAFEQLNIAEDILLPTDGDGDAAEDEDELAQPTQPMLRPAFDVILCLNVTKFVHLCYGDDGIRRMFRAMYELLKPGGRLIIQIQQWAAYQRDREKLPLYWHNATRISLRPAAFPKTLMNMGLLLEAQHSVLEGVRCHRRPMFVFYKP